ncbi:hypothetical protein [Mycobacterium deserti]|uniref:Uncharacterized protein n=1 Tax=Mycobacterium deserti TaxID=2978347 RepID=A0ABT2MCL8_9MYCO|nr:hypothetical protein [Mycobacterium deserti]MCT7660014.1 hypothetical protein [Mycobacterium deserti]
MTEREAPSRDFDYASDDLDDDGGWFGHAPFVQEHHTEPIPLAAELVDSPTQPDNGQSDYYGEPEQISVHPDLIEDPALEYAAADDPYPVGSDEAAAPAEPGLNGSVTHPDFAPAADYYEPVASPAEPHVNGTFADTEYDASTGYDEPGYEPEPEYIEPESEYSADDFAESAPALVAPNLSGAHTPTAYQPPEASHEPEPEHERFDAYDAAPDEPELNAVPVPTERTSPRTDPAWTTNGQLRLTEINPLDFKRSTRPPWYRGRRALVGLIAAAVIVLFVVIVSLVIGNTGTEETTGPAPAPSTTPAPATSSAPVVPSAVQPALTSAPAPPPPPPPPPAAPPPPAPVQDNAPAYTPRYQPPRSDPPAERKPDTGVTRAPISVAPDHKATPSGPEVGKHGANDGGTGWG